MPVQWKVEEFVTLGRMTFFLIYARYRAVVIVPTRELAVQVYNETRKYAYGTVVTCKAVYGGTAVGYQKDELRKVRHYVFRQCVRFLGCHNCCSYAGSFETFC